DHRDLHSFPTRRSSDLGANDPPLNPLSIFSQIIEEIPTGKLLRFIRFSFQSRKTKTLNIIYKEFYMKKLKSYTRIWSVEKVIYRSEEHTSELQSRFDIV